MIHYEDKVAIVSALYDLLCITRAGNDLVGMRYRRDREVVTLFFKNGVEKDVNVECDSGIALIRDVCRRLG